MIERTLFDDVEPAGTPDASDAPPSPRGAHAAGEVSASPDGGDDDSEFIVHVRHDDDRFTYYGGARQ